MYTIIQTKKFLKELDMNKPAAFLDIDHTIIFPKGKKRFYSTKDNYGWVFRPNVKDKLQEITKTHTIFFITNQSKYDRIVEKRINDMMDSLQIESMSLIATGRDQFRKPGIGFLIDDLKIPFNLTRQSFHCGDAAGRLKDFSDDDFWFAQHAKVKFLTPEELFDGDIDLSKPFSKIDLVRSPLIDRDIVKTLKGFIKDYDGIMLIGLPGSGKSYMRDFIIKNIGIKNPVIFNNDKKLFPKEFPENPFFILDNTNTTPALRLKYPPEVLTKNIAKIMLDIPVKDCIRGIKYRVSIGGTYIPDVTIYSINKKMEVHRKELNLIFKNRPVLDLSFPPYLA